MAVLCLTDVVKIYSGGVRAVDGFSLDIADGEFIVLVGPSGCGKSTVLRSIAGLEEISSGDIRMDGRSMLDLSPKDRDLAMVFQSYALYPHMTVYDNLAFGLRMRNTLAGAIDERVKEAARMLGLDALLDRKPKALSGGQRQRVAVGRAIVRNPKCFLFDEPLSNVDAKVRAEMRAEIKQLQMRLGTTSVYVTHDQEEAMTLGDRIVVMREGVIQQTGPPLDVYRYPANRFVAGFLGTPQMNFLEGRIVAEHGMPRFESAALSLPLQGNFSAKRAAVVAGFRPHAIRLEPGRESVPLSATAEWIEPLGDRMDLHLSAAGGQRLIARVETRNHLRKDEISTLYVDIDQVHLFNADEEGVRLAGEAICR